MLITESFVDLVLLVCCLESFIGFFIVSDSLAFGIFEAWLGGFALFLPGDALDSFLQVG